METILAQTPEAAAWPHIAPLLDEALAKLNETDRRAVLLRYFEGHTLAEVGTVLAMNEDAARKRVARGLDKLRQYFLKRGVTLTATVIAGAVAANSVQAAPIGLAVTVTAAAAKGAAIGGSTLTLIKGALKLMAWSKAQTAIVIGVVVLLAAGTTITVKEIQEHKTYSWQVPKADFDLFYKTRPQVRIVSTKFKDKTTGDFCCDEGRGAMGIAVQLKEIIQLAYQKDNLRTVIATKMPSARYDFFAKLVNPPANDTNWTLALQKEISTKFGIIGHFEMRNADVLILKAGNAGAHGFKVSHEMPNGQAMQPIFEPAQNGVRVGYHYHEQPVSTLTRFFEGYLQLPIVDEANLDKEYDFSLSWVQPSNEHTFELPSVNELNPILLNQLGLMLAATNMPIEMLVTER